MTDLQNLFTRTMDTLKTSVAGQNKYPLVDVQSTVDGKNYKVRDMPDKQRAADLLANVRQKISNLYMSLRDKFPNKPQIRQWVKNFTPDPSRF